MGPRPQVSEPNDELSSVVWASLISMIRIACRRLRSYERAICSLPLSDICSGLS
jgi:hypothetical protein